MTDRHSAGVQRHHKIYLMNSVRRQGRLVEWWWRFQYVQYTYLSIFGFMCRVSENKGKLNRGKIARWSERYVVGFFVVAIVLFGTRTAMEDQFGGSISSSVSWVSAVIGGYRVYEIVFSQAYYLLQTGTNRVTSFTRTLLFHVVFIMEISLHSANIALNETCWSVWRSFALAFQSLTLQGNFLDEKLPERMQVVYAGCSVVGLVILVGSLPMVLGASSRSLGQHT